MPRFCDELIARVRRAGASGPVLLRADSGFWNTKVFDKLHGKGWQFSIGVRMTKPVAAQVAQVPESAWTPLTDYPKTGEAQIAESTLSGRRLVVRRVRLLAAPGEMFPREWRHFPFATSRTDDITIIEAEHRQHAVVEQVIRDLKDQALTHFPSGSYDANAAWTVLACIAHNLLRWTTVIGLPGTIVRVARTVRRRLLRMPGRLTRTARQWTLHLPRPLALAGRLPRRSAAATRAPRARLSKPAGAHQQRHDTWPSGRDHPCPRTPPTPRAQARTRPPARPQHAHERSRTSRSAGKRQHAPDQLAAPTETVDSG